MEPGNQKKTGRNRKATRVGQKINSNKMKKKLLLSTFLLTMSSMVFCKTWTITNAGKTFTPDTITITLGDSVNFVIDGSHDAREVSQTTWMANGNTALPGGFQTPFGGGLVLPEKLTVGTHYYVCTPHADDAMKAVIIVKNSPTTGVQENKLNTNITIYPNPASDLITVKSSSNTLGSTYIITDQTGRNVMAGQLNNERTLVDITLLAKGIYLFHIQGPNRETFKVIKNR